MFIVLTGSAAALSVSVIGLVYYQAIRFCKRVKVNENTFIVSLFFTTVIVVGFLNSYLGYFLELLGRDPTLTGRTLLWAWAIDVINEKPILGWGYLAYNGSQLAGSIADTYTEFQNYNVPHFHNGYLQLLVEGGAVTFIPYILSLLYCIRFYYKQYINHDSKYALAGVAILLMLLTAGFFVNVMFKYNDMLSCFFMMLIAYSFTGENIKI
jgi:O-antigen ligase